MSCKVSKISESVPLVHLERLEGAKAVDLTALDRLSRNAGQPPGEGAPTPMRDHVHIGEHRELRAKLWATVYRIGGIKRGGMT